MPCVKLKTGSSWGCSWLAMRTSPCPSPREGHCAVMLRSKNSMYVCGGGEGGALDTFQFDMDFRKWFKVETIGEGATSKSFPSAWPRQRKVAICSDYIAGLIRPSMDRPTSTPSGTFSCDPLSRPVWIESEPRFGRCAI